MCFVVVLGYFCGFVLSFTSVTHVSFIARLTAGSTGPIDIVTRLEWSATVGVTVFRTARAVRSFSTGWKNKGKIIMRVAIQPAPYVPLAQAGRPRDR